MNRKNRQQPPVINPRGVKALRPGDIAVILRGAEGMLPDGDRIKLANLLKGRIHGRGLDQNPVFGIYQHLSEREILSRIDWLILNRYLQAVGRGSSEQLTFTGKGWEIAKDIHAAELQEDLDEMLQSGEPPYDLTFLHGVNHEVSNRLLERIDESQDKRYLPLLEEWAVFENKKMRKRIGEVIKHLE